MLKELSKVFVPNVVVIGVVSLTELEVILKIILLISSVVYTILHCIVLARKLKKKDSDD